MNRNRTTLVIATLALAILMPACRKKKPEPPPPVPMPAVQSPQPVTDVSPRPQGEVRDATPDPLSGDIVAVNDFVTRNGLLGDVYFEFDRADLSEESRSRLARNADWLRSHPEFEVRIEGHCDERGTNEYNLALGERRAKATMNYLVGQGVQANRITIISYGKERPTCTEHSEACWAKNRRAHFLVKAR